MYKIRQPSSPVVNVVLGQTATHELNRGPRYHDLTYAVTITKTGLTAGNAFQPLPADALDLITVLVNDSERRMHTAAEMDAVQTRWSPNLSIVKFDQVGNDLVTAVADVVNATGGVVNGVPANSTVRTTTFLVVINFAEPSRSTFADREKFAWPTAWASGRTAKVVVKLKVPANAGVTAPVITCQESVDYVLGPVVNGKDSMPITAWVRQEEVYAGLKPVIRKWSFTGILQQISIFSPTDQPDYIAKLKVKLGTAVIWDGSKGDADYLCDRNQWNVNGKAAGRYDFAADYGDNPGDAVNIDGSTLFEVSPTLTQAASANKTLVLINQVYQDAIA